MTRDPVAMLDSEPTDPETTDSEAADGARLVKRGRLWLLAAVGRFGSRSLVLPVIALVLAVALSALVVANHQRTTEDDVRAEVPKTLTAHVAKLLSYTPATVSSDLATEKKWLTGDFFDEYQTLITKTVAPAATKAGVTADATVVASAVESVTGHRIELLMFVNVATTRTGAKAPETQGSRVRVVAEKVHGAWLISSLAPV